MGKTDVEVPAAAAGCEPGREMAAAAKDFQFEGAVGENTSTKKSRKFCLTSEALMNNSGLTRRELLIGTGTALAATAVPFSAAAQLQPDPQAPEQTGDPVDRARRMKWWHEARFGMFIHWGLYSVLGRHEWVMENEGIPVSEYEPLA